MIKKDIFLSIIPQPVKMRVNSGSFIFNHDTVIHSDLELENISEYLKLLITPPTGFNMQIEVGGANHLHKNVLGIETPMWTEWAPTPKRLYWQIFPRFSAHAETGWSLLDNKNYTSFKVRLDQILKRLDILGVQSAELNETDPNFIKRLFNFRTIINGIKLVNIFKFLISLKLCLEHLERIE